MKGNGGVGGQTTFDMSLMDFRRDGVQGRDRVMDKGP